WRSDFLLGAPRPRRSGPRSPTRSTADIPADRARQSCRPGAVSSGDNPPRARRMSRPEARPRRRRASGPRDLRPQAAAVTLEQPSELGARDQGDDDVADRVRRVEPEAAAELDGQRCPGVWVEAVPLPDVHQAAEGEAEDEAEERERNAPADERRGEGADDAAAAPGEHLPRRPGTLAEEEVRGQRGECADTEARAGAERGAGRDRDHRHRLNAGDRGEEDPPAGRGRGERGNERERLARAEAGIEPGGARNEQRSGDQQQGEGALLG